MNMLSNTPLWMHVTQQRLYPDHWVYTPFDRDIPAASDLHVNFEAYRTLAAIQDTAASVDARRQRRKSDRYTLPTSVLAL